MKSRTQIPETLQEVFQLRTEIIQGKDIKLEDLDKLIDSRVSVSRLKAEVIEGYSYLIAKHFFSIHGYNVSNEGQEFDFIAQNGPVHILFEIRLSSTALNSGSLDNMFRKYINYSFRNKTQTYFILLIYKIIEKNTTDTFYKKFIEGLNHEYEIYENNFIVYNVPQPHYRHTTYELQNFMERVLAEIENKRLLLNKKKGRWTNEWSFNDPNKKGQENLEITTDGSYLIDGKPVFIIYNLTVNDVQQTVSFIKQRTDDGTRLLNELKLSDDRNTLTGIETNLGDEQDNNYEIRYTKIND